MYKTSQAKWKKKKKNWFEISFQVPLAMWILSINQRGNVHKKAIKKDEKEKKKLLNTRLLTCNFVFIEGGTFDAAADYDSFVLN